MTERTALWSEAQPSPEEPVWNVIMAIVYRRGENWYEALGTGFVAAIQNDGALAVGAAHVFEQIYRYQKPSEPRARTLFTREIAQRIDLDPDQVFAIIFDNGHGHLLRMSNLFYDAESDTAWFSVHTVDPSVRGLFRHNIRFDPDMAKVGDEVEGIGFRRMEFRPEMHGTSLYTVFRGCLARRMGTVTEVLDRTIKLKGPGAHVSFPIFGGMSGGPVLKLNTGKDPAAFAILSSDYEDPAEQKDDVFMAGTTTISKLPITWTVDFEGERTLQIRFLGDDEGRGDEN